MLTRPDDILTPRLVLRLMEREVVADCLAAIPRAPARRWASAFRASCWTNPRNYKPSLALIARFGFVEIGQHEDPIDGVEHIFLREIGA